MRSEGLADSATRAEEAQVRAVRLACLLLMGALAAGKWAHWSYLAEELRTGLIDRLMDNIQ